MHRIDHDAELSVTFPDQGMNFPTGDKDWEEFLWRASFPKDLLSMTPEIARAAMHILCKFYLALIECWIVPTGMSLLSLWDWMNLILAK